MKTTLRLPDDLKRAVSQAEASSVGVDPSHVARRAEQLLAEGIGR